MHWDKLKHGERKQSNLSKDYRQITQLYSIELFLKHQHKSTRNPLNWFYKKTSSKPRLSEFQSHHPLRLLLVAH